MITTAEWKMEPELKVFWDFIKVSPHKWRLSPKLVI